MGAAARCLLCPFCTTCLNSSEVGALCGGAHAALYAALLALGRSKVLSAGEASCLKRRLDVVLGRSQARWNAKAPSDCILGKRLEL